MKQGLFRIAWGLIFELIDFRIQNFDLLPDAIGYLLIMIGAARLMSHHKSFKTAWLAAGVSFIGAIVQLFGSFRADIPIIPSENLSPSAMIQAAAVSAIGLLMMYGICDGVRACALAANKRGLARSALAAWRFLFGLTMLLLIVLPFHMNRTPQEMLTFTLLLGLGTLIATIRIIVIVRRAGRELNGGGGGGDGTDPVGGRIDMIA